MSIVDPRSGPTDPSDSRVREDGFGDGAGPSDQDPQQRRSRWADPWIWVSAALAVAAIGLLVWGLNTKSDLDKANDHIKQLQTQLGAGAVAGSAAAASYKSAYDDLQEQVGNTSADLSTTQADLKQAQDEAAAAEKEAAAAKKEADAAQSETDKANAEKKQAQADAKAAESKSKITTECAQAYLASIGKLFQGDDPKSQASDAKQELQGIHDDCQKALAGT